MSQVLSIGLGFHIGKKQKCKQGIHTCGSHGPHHPIIPSRVPGETGWELAVGLGGEKDLEEGPEAQ